MREYYTSQSLNDVPAPDTQSCRLFASLSPCPPGIHRHKYEDFLLMMSEIVSASASHGHVATTVIVRLRSGTFSSAALTPPNMLMLDITLCLHPYTGRSDIS